MFRFKQGRGGEATKSFTEYVEAPTAKAEAAGALL
jgi:hypothetical protein